jgi:hypothetical protein
MTPNEQIKEGVINELRDEETRKSNIILYRAQESSEEDKKDQQKEDSQLILELIKDHLEIADFDPNQITKWFRLGKKREGVIRPLLLKLDSVETKIKIFKQTRKLAKAPEKFKKIAIDHDLTPRQRETQRELRAKANRMEEEDTSGEYIYRVRGPPGAMVVKRMAKRKAGAEAEK